MMKFTKFFTFKKIVPVMAVFAVAYTIFSFGSYDPYNELSSVTPENASAQVLDLTCSLTVVGGSHVPFGGSATIEWDVQGYGPVTLNGNSVANTGTLTIDNIERNTPYTIHAELNENGISLVCNETVTIICDDPLPTCDTFRSNPEVITLGGSSVLSWTTSNANSVSISGLTGSFELDGSVTVSPTVTTVYTLTVVGSGGSQVTCSATVTVTSAPLAPTCDTFTAVPSVINAGQSSVLNWTTSNGNSVSISGLTGSFELDGSRTVSPVVTTTYVLTVTGNNGQQAVCEATVTVVTGHINAPVCNSFSANPERLPIGGGNVTLAWNTTYGDSVVITPGIGSVNQRGTRDVVVTATQTYTLTVTGANNQQDTCTVTITVDTPNGDNAPVCNSFSANPERLPIGGGNVTLAWNTTYGDSVVITPGIGSVNQRGTRDVVVTATQTYTLTVTGANNQQDTCTVTITVDTPSNVPACYSLIATPSTINAGQTTTLSWSSQNAVTAFIDNGVGAVATSGPAAVYSVSPRQTTTYTLTVFGATNDLVNSCRVTVNVTSTPAPISCQNNVTFTANPSSIRRGNDTTLNWSTNGIESVRFDNGITSTDISGATTVSPTNSTTYNLIATTGGTTISCPVTVSVTSGGGGGGSSSPRCELTVSKNKIKSGDKVTLSWDSSRATQLVIEDQTTNKEIVSTEGLSNSDKEDLFEGTKIVSPEKDTTYLMTVSRGSSKRTCRVTVDVTDGVTIDQTRDQQPLISGISLDQVPYTGFEAGPILTVIFYLLLMAWALYVAYLLVIKRDQLGGLTLASNVKTEIPTRFVSEAVSPQMVAASVATKEEPVSFLPNNLPVAVIGYENLNTEVAKEVVEENDHSLSESEMVQIENYAHSKQVLLSSDAINYFVSNTNSDTERTKVLDQVIKASKEKYPAEDGWVVLNENKMKEVCLACQANSVKKEEVVNYIPTVVPSGSSSLAEAIVTGNIISAYEMIGNRPMFALADAAADLDNVYRIRRGGEGKVSELLMKETAKLSDEKILQLIDALTDAIDGTYTDEAAAVKMSIMKAVKVIN